MSKLPYKGMSRQHLATVCDLAPALRHITYKMDFLIVEMLFLYL